ncbi:MAG TPA: hypothetical protein VF471_16785 [Pseudoxanthomonas sp.]
MVRAKRVGTMLDWTIVETIKDGDNGEPSFIADDKQLKEDSTSESKELLKQVTEACEKHRSGQNGDISYFIPEGASVRLEIHGDIDHDGDSDVLVVLRTSNEAQDRFKPRTLLVLRRNVSGELEKEVSNENAILCQACGGMMGDPLQGISIDTAGFTLRFEGGSRELWSQEYRFSYSTKFHTWLLDSVNSSESERLEDNSRSNRSRSRHLGSIPIDNFDSSEFPVTALP